ncbi:CHAP domain-containing protein [Streptococcus constellatus]|uniref:CHAP domain-containing protein n=1 Tax=Streptococcus constellatus TaxID=76860 RepID=UPI00241C9C6D|nr:CHAP domain-containing protein [Streptococcus constellatus]HEN2308646.1 CHAP domain-containing protein [Streptococcus agalactiae]
MKVVKRFSLLFVLLAPLLAVLFLFIGASSTIATSSSSTVDGITYVEHWSDGDAYTHNLLIHRYGITEEQLDSFLDSTGIAYDKNRINGKLLLEWSKKSGLDVRAIVAIAQMESSFGTAGVATKSGANMFGYGAFDSNPNNATNYNDENAVIALTKQTIINNRNETFKIQDEKAQKHAKGALNVASDGGVYFTDTSGSGKKRAEVMEKLDKWIDDHGGTPQAPKNTPKTRDGGGVTSGDIPAGYSLTKAIDTSGYSASTYPWGQCTWFVWNRARELGITFDPYMGNGGDWKYKAGFTTTNTPTEHSAVCFSPSQSGADPTYGHIAFVEQVKSDGSILISESNSQGLGVVSYRTFNAETAKQFTYVIGK